VVPKSSCDRAEAKGALLLLIPRLFEQAERCCFTKRYRRRRSSTVSARGSDEHQQTPTLVHYAAVETRDGNTVDHIVARMHS
jgi:hypothetical protein